MDDDALLNDPLLPDEDELDDLEAMADDDGRRPSKRARVPAEAQATAASVGFSYTPIAFRDGTVAMAAPSASSDSNGNGGDPPARKSALSRLGQKQEPPAPTTAPTGKGSRDLRQTLSRRTGTRPFQFNALNNVVVKSAAIAAKRYPSPELERTRSTMLTELANKFKSLCKERLEIEAPMHAIARWYYDQLSVTASQFAVDPLLRYPDSAVETELLSREMLQEIPCRLPGRAFRDWKMGTRYITLYVQRAEHWKNLVLLNHRGVEEVAAELEAAVGPLLAEAKVWVESKQYDDSATEEELRAMLVKLRDECSPVFRKFSKAEVEAVCREMASAAEDVVLELQHVGAALLQEQAEMVAALEGRVQEAVAAAEAEAAATAAAAKAASADGEAEASPPTAGSMRAAVVATALAQCKEERPVLISENEGDGFRLLYRGDGFSLKREAVAKLRELYSIHNADMDPDGLHFLSVLYCCLCRYKMLSALQKVADFEMALPPAFMAALVDHLEVCFEGFASPANAYFRNFCSGCPDVDVFFGSVGSFFEMEPDAGSFELFPPFVEEVLDKLAAQLEHLLAKASGALSFVVVMPEWRDPLLPALSLLESSSWLRAQFSVSSRRQGMVSGTAFSTDPRESWRHLAFAEFHVYVLQNEAATKQWPITDAKLLLLKRALGQ